MSSSDSVVAGDKGDEGASTFVDSTCSARVARASSAGSGSNSVERSALGVRGFFGGSGCCAGVFGSSGVWGPSASLSFFTRVVSCSAVLGSWRVFGSPEIFGDSEVLGFSRVAVAAGVPKVISDILDEGGGERVVGIK